MVVRLSVCGETVVVVEAETCFVWRGDERIAYQAVGSGPVDVLVARPTFFPIDFMWYEPRLAQFLNDLSLFCRHIWFDARGVGASSAISQAEGRLTESYVDDMLAVV